MLIFAFNTCKNDQHFQKTYFKNSPPLIGGIRVSLLVILHASFWGAGLFVMNGYQLTRNWYNFKFENPNTVRHIHSDMYFYIVDLWNRLGQKEKMGLPTAMTMDALNIGSYNTYKKVLADLIEWGFVLELSKSTNQYQSRVIALSITDEATDKPLDKAHAKASDKPTDTIIEQENKRTKEDLKGESGDSPHSSSSLKPPLSPAVKTFEDNYKAFINHFNKLKGEETGNIGRFKGEPKSKRQFKDLIKDHSGIEIVKAIRAMFRDQHHIDHKYRYVTPEFATRPAVFARFLEQS